MPARYFVQSLDRGLRVLSAFDGAHPVLSLREAAEATGLNKATARRFLLTLSALGYVHQSEDGHFSLTPKVLDLGDRFLAGLSLTRVAAPELERLTEAVGEASNVAVADGADVVYVVRVPVRHKILSVNLHVGSRLPLHATSLGKVLLWGMSPEERTARLGPEPFTRFTPHTRTTYAALEQDFDAAGRDGVIISSGELEEGLRSMAAPITDWSGTVMAAVNVSTHVLDTSVERLMNSFRPSLIETAQRISKALGGR